MLVQFTQDVSTAWAKDTCHDLHADVARGFISAGQAVESNLGAFVEASRKADFAKFKGEMLDEFRTLAAAKPAPKGPPAIKTTADGRGIEVPEGARIEGAPEARKKDSFTDALRCIFVTQSRGAPQELVDYCQNKLRNVYAEEAVEYRVDQSTGQLDVVRTRTLENGGMETITRTGTDSLSGGATYGFTLKPTYLDTLFEIAMEQGVFAPATTGLQIQQGLELKWPALGQYNAPTTVNGIPMAAVFGGITFAYKGEITPRVASDAIAEMINFKAVDLTAFTTYSRDYIVDNYIAMDAVVTRIFGRGMGWVEDWVSIRGDGVGKPQGYFNSAAVISGGAASGNATRFAANKISVDDLMWMMSKMATMCWGGARWIANVTTIPQLGVLRDDTGAAIFQPNALIAQYEEMSIKGASSYDKANLMSRPMGRLIGWPIYFSEKVPVLGTTGDISLVCPDQYAIARRAGLEIGVSDQFLFQTDEIAYRVKMRHDGKSLWRLPYQQADGSNTTVSPFILLHSNP